MNGKRAKCVQALAFLLPTSLTCGDKGLAKTFSALAQNVTKAHPKPVKDADGAIQGWEQTGTNITL
jgi:hypothetical protein